jgi:hypothetical protein
MALSRLLLISLAATAAVSAQTPAAEPPSSGRMFGVMANYRTAEASAKFQALKPARKFYIAYRDSFDWPSYGLGALTSGVSQWRDSNPSFGQGMKGYAHRYAASWVDGVTGNMMSEAILPTLLREDPRYFRLGSGPMKRRIGYSLTRLFVTRTDAGGSRFNTSEILGNSIAAALGNAYYPDNRSTGKTAYRLSLQLSLDTFSNVMKEFWPDIQRKMQKRN